MSHLSPHPRAALSRICLFFAVPALALSSISTLAAGLTWLFLSLAGVFVWLASDKINDCRHRSEQAWALHAAKWWLLTCIAAFVLMALPTAYWGGPWPERHPQWRLLIGALGLWLLLRHQSMSTRTLHALATAAAVSLPLGLGLVIFLGANAAPTNRIPWVAGLSLLSCTLLCLSYGLQAAPMWLRRTWWLSSCSAMVTVLISGVRGSWLLLLVWPVAWFFLQRTDRRLLALTPRRVLLVLLMLSVSIAIGMRSMPEHDRPWTRMALIIQESGLGSASVSIDASSSVGVRLGLYKAGVEQAWKNPTWLGIGHAEHKAKIRQHLQDMGSTPEMANSIGHYHSDWLNPWAEFGIMGVLGYLSYATGMLTLWVGAFKRQESHLSIGISTVLVMHIGTGMTNVNFAHNYYPVMFSLCLFLLTASQAVSIRSSQVQ